MQVAFCANCGKHTGHKRSIGVGTALGAVVTGGASLLAVPAYGKRCVICGLTEAQAQSVTAPRPASKPRVHTRLEIITFLVALAVCGIVVLAIASQWPH